MASQRRLNENIDPSNIFLTGNTVIDALLFSRKKIENNALLYKQQYPWDGNGNKIVLITGHRRENFGEGFENICYAIKELAAKYVNYNFVYPVHLNPNVQEPVNRLLNDAPNIYLIPPMDYVQFTILMSNSYFILTDSGGVQEEAPSLKKPVLVMRETTERPEAVKTGGAKLVGTDKDIIVKNVIALMEDKELFDKMSNAGNPFGDGHAAERILKQTLAFFK
jgi:UDP-N-acetylglucosamine 2-epimerase (non-hydrolysing)